MNRLRQLIYIAAFALLLSIISRGVFAQVTKPVYPIGELGNCRDAKECYLYCEIPANKAACWSYGKYVLNKDVLGEETDTEMEAEVRRLGITFPIAELGNCANVRECRDYCEQTEHHQTCTDFAKKHGLHREDERAEQEEDELLEAARNELGCTSKSSCLALCEQPENHEKCRAFAERHGLEHEDAEPDPEKQRILEKARTELGCESMESCRSICEQDKQRCMDFARRHGLHEEGDSPPPAGGPGGCRTQEECDRYCREHEEECNRFKSEHPPEGEHGERETGPGGCDSDESCRRYCEEHPDECQGRPHTQDMPREDQEHEETYYVGPDGCKTEEDCRAYCEAHPDQCPGFKEAGGNREHDEGPREDKDSHDEYLEKDEIRDEDYRKYYDDEDYSEDLSDEQPSVDDPAAFCTNKGCTWTGEVCQCDDGSFIP